MVLTNSLLTIAGFLTAASAAPAAVSKRSSAPYGVKKGVCYPAGDGSAAQVLAVSGHGPTWSYNWGTAEQAPKYEQIPMCFNTQCNTGAIASDLNSVSSDHRYVLGYNEPDESTQYGGSDISPGAAYDAWGNQLFPLVDNQGARLICPAITSYNTASGHNGFAAGLTWLNQLVNHNANNKDPNQFRCFAQAIHWYGCGGSADDQANAFKSYVADAHNQINSLFGKNMPLWITEFSPGDSSCNAAAVSDADRAEFLKQVGPWMNQQDYIDRYSFFDDDYLVQNGQLTLAGNAYVYNM